MWTNQLFSINSIIAYPPLNVTGLILKKVEKFEVANFIHLLFFLLSFFTLLSITPTARL